RGHWQSVGHGVKTGCPIRTLRQVTQPSSFSNSLMSTTTGAYPSPASRSADAGADAAISTSVPPSGTTWQPVGSGTATAPGNDPASTRPPHVSTRPSGNAVVA